MFLYSKILECQYHISCESVLIGLRTNSFVWNFLFFMFHFRSSRANQDQLSPRAWAKTYAICFWYQGLAGEIHYERSSQPNIPTLFQIHNGWWKGKIEVQKLVWGHWLAAQRIRWYWCIKGKDNTTKSQLLFYFLLVISLVCMCIEMAHNCFVLVYLKAVTGNGFYWPYV